MRDIALAVLVVAVVACASFKVVAQGLTPAPGPLTNENVIALHRGGLSTDVIVNAINHAAATRFDVSPKALLELKSAGVAEAVILALQTAAREASKLVSGTTPTPSLAEARSAFLVNAAVGPNWIGISDRFKELRTELRTWRRFEIVDAPDQADVIITLGTGNSGQTGAVVLGNMIVAASSPVYTLTIQQRATDRVLWASSEQVGSFSAKGTLKKLLKRLREQVPSRMDR